MNAASAMVAVTLGVLIPWGAMSVSAHLERNCTGIKRTVLVSVEVWLRGDCGECLLQEGAKAHGFVLEGLHFHNLDPQIHFMNSDTPDPVELCGLGYNSRLISEWVIC